MTKDSDVVIDTTQIEAFFARIDKAARGDFKKKVNEWLEALGDEFLRILEDEIIRRNVVDSRLLLNSFHKGTKENVWKLQEGKMTLTVGTNLKYAQFVNDGHWTNKKGQDSRFVPGYWQGDRFVYQKGASTGMVLKQQWVDGEPYWDSAIRIMERILPQLLEAKLQEWLNDYFDNLF